MENGTRIVMSGGLSIDTKLSYEEVQNLIDEASRVTNDGSYREKDLNSTERTGLTNVKVNIEKFIVIPQIDGKLDITINIHYIQAFFTMINIDPEKDDSEE